MAREIPKGGGGIEDTIHYVTWGRILLEKDERRFLKMGWRAQRDR